MSIQNQSRRGLLVVLALLLIAPWRAGAESKEYQIKAAFLFNFTHFVNWPATAFASPGAPFRIGVLGENPFGPALDEAVRGETVDNRKLVVLQARQIEDLRECQVVFISKSEEGHLSQVLSRLAAKPVLTVSEIDGFGRNGGMIRLYLEGNKVRFEINPSVAQQNGLKISSQLLSLGKIVQSEPVSK